MKPVDIYVRVSRVGGREHLISPEEQERRARGLAKQRGLTVGEVLVDLDESGGKWDRPGLQLALDRVRAGKSGGLIVAWLDRLSRDSEHAHRLLRELSESGGSVYAPDAPEDMTSPEGELQVGIAFVFAQYVRKRAREGFERAKERSIAAGVPVTPFIPAGYRRNGERRLVVDPKAASAIREAFERRAAGEGPSSIARFLTAAGVKTSHGARSWSRQGALSLLRSRVYLGELSFGKDRRFVNPEAHEPIVDLATWTAAQAPKRPRLRPAEASLLAGLLRCPACGYVMQLSRRRGVDYYRCSRQHAGGLCPIPTSVRASHIEAAVETMFWTTVGAWEARIEESTVDLDDLTETLQRAEERLAQVETPEMQDAFGDRWATVVRERREERDAAAAALGHAQVAAGATPIRNVVTLREFWDDPATTTAERRELLGAEFDAVVVRRSGRDVEFAIFAAGAAPDLIRRRGPKGPTPTLRPIDVDPGAWAPLPKKPGERLANAV